MRYYKLFSFRPKYEINNLDTSSATYSEDNLFKDE